VTAKPGAKRQAESEARKKAAGYVQFKCWVHRDDALSMRAHAEKLADKRAKVKPKSKKQREDEAKMLHEERKRLHAVEALMQSIRQR
jgi:hypothetical protein